MQTHSQLLQTVRSDWKEGRGKILVAISAGWFLSIGVRVTYPVLLPYMRAEYGLSLTAAGFLLTVLWLAYAIGQIPGGALGDLIGEGRTMVVSTLVAAATIVLVVTAPSPAVLYVGTAALGFAIALYGVVRLTVLLEIYPDRVGTTQGIVAAVGDVGNTVLPPTVGLIATATAWQVGLGFLIPIIVLVTIGLWVVVPARIAEPSTADESISMESVRNVLSELRHPAIVLVTTVQILAFCVQQAFMGFYPTYLIELKGIAPAVANGLFALFFALGVFVKPLAGNAYDRVDARWALLVMTASSAVALAVLPFVNGFWPLALVTIFGSAMLGRGTTAMAYMTVSLSENVRNTGLGILRTLFFAIGAISPLIFGAIADRGYFDEAFLLLAVVSGVTIVIIFWLPPSVDP